MTQVEDRGTGRPVLWLPSSFGETPWIPAHERLSASCRVVVPQAPVFRPGGALEGVRTMEDYVIHLVDVMDAVGLDRAAVVGTSFGGWVAAEMAGRYPERVAALALVGAMGLRLEGEPAAEIFTLTPGELARVLFVDPESAANAAAVPTFDREADPKARFMRLVEGEEAMARMGWSPYLHDPRLPERLGRYRGPALVIWGGADQVLPLAHARAWADLLGARLEVVEGAGHLPAVERPDVVADLICSWVAGAKG